MSELRVNMQRKEREIPEEKKKEKKKKDYQDYQTSNKQSSLAPPESKLGAAIGRKRNRPTTPLRIGCEVNPLSTTLSPDE
jgi:hypothetical protein